MNIKYEFDEVVRLYGHNVVFCKLDKRFRCKSCYSERSGGPKFSNCPDCLGTSYTIHLKKIRVRRKKTSSPPISYSTARKATGPGVEEPIAFVYYLQSEVEPKPGDRIFEMIWDNGKPKGIQKKFIISAVEPMHGTDGRIEFYQTYARYVQKGAKDDDSI